ncbi:MAG TPA: GlsB/YeaQ/YmgE family stress response membrane protein [Dehalococcoidia bacterium]|nr:GlsB/YeaQ/YmgE family stress response membrane protein [Dehalococcoidia bacterium]
MGAKGGLLKNTLLGLVGAIVGGVLFSLIGLGGASNIIGSIVIATVGAVIVLAIVK